MPRIVLAIEQHTAEQVVQAGGELASALGGRVVLAHVRHDAPLVSPAALPLDVDAVERVEVGNAAGHLAAIAAELEAALIVVGSWRRNQVPRALLLNAPCPVMVVPRAVSRQLDYDSNRSVGRGTVLAGVDPSRRSGGTVSLARTLAERFGDRLLIVHPNTPAQQLADTLSAVASREHTRLVVIGAGSRSDTSLPSRSVAEKVLESPPCPLVVVPDGVAVSLDRRRQDFASQVA